MFQKVQSLDFNSNDFIIPQKSEDNKYRKDLLNKYSCLFRGVSNQLFMHLKIKFIAVVTSINKLTNSKEWSIGHAK